MTDASEMQRLTMRRRLAAELGGAGAGYMTPGQAFAANGSDFPDDGFLQVSDQPSTRPVPQPDSYRQSPFAAPGAPPMQNPLHKPNTEMRDVAEEMTELEGVVDTSKLNDTPLWNGGGMTLDEVGKSHPPIAPLLKKWQREAVEAYTMMLQREGMSKKKARREALKEVGPGAKIEGMSLDPPGEMFPEEWGADSDDFDANGQVRTRTRNHDFMSMGEFLRRVLEVPWPQGQPIPPDIQQELDDLLQDHQYDQKGKRLGPTSSLNGVDLLLSSIYRRNMSPAA